MSETKRKTPMVTSGDIDINDKLIEGLEEYKIKVELLREREGSWAEEIVEKDKQIDKLEARIEKYLDYKVKKARQITELEEELKEKDLIIHAVKTDQVKYKVDVVNDWTDMCSDDTPPKQIRIGDYYYAFIKNEYVYALMILTEDNDWVEVSDLTELKVWEYQEIKSYAVAVGMIKEDEDLFI